MSGDLLSIKRLPMGDRRAVGGPVSRALLAAYFAVALAAWVAASLVAVAAADDLAAGSPLARDPVLAVHLVALGALPFAVAGACFHLLPVMLRNDLPFPHALWLALVLLLGGPVVASGLGRSTSAVWTGAALVSVGLAIVLAEILTLVVRAPSGRMLIASRLGIALSCAHVVAALVVGALLFSGDLPFEHVSYLRSMLVHLHLALLGWIALLVVTVGRNLGPMLAMAPAAPRRERPVAEIGLVAGLWILLGGIASASRAATLAGAFVVLVALGSFVVLMLRTMRVRRGPLEAPLAHLVAGGLFLAQAAGFGIGAAAGAGGTRLVIAYVVFLLVGWAGGVVIGHVGKLLSLSLWVWWPPGPRPKQAALYPRALGLAEAIAFAAGVETFALGILAGSDAAARTGAVVLSASAVLTAAGAVLTWRRRSR